MASTGSEASSRHLISFQEVQKHDQEGDCWLVVNGQVLDLSNFEHPGGAEIIIQHAGSDASTAFNRIHAPGILKGLAPEQFRGDVDQSSIPCPVNPKDLAEAESKEVPTPEGHPKPPLHSLIALHDFEDVARKTYSAKAYAFYSSGATDLVSLEANSQVHKRLLLRPRVLRNVRQIRTSRKILGFNSSAPFFVSPTAMAKLAHPDGEIAIAKGCGEKGIIQTISTNASFPLEDIVAAGLPGQPFFLQLYVNSERSKTEELLQSAHKLGIKAIFVTVDAPVPGKREADERIAAGNLTSAISGAVATNDKKGGGLGRVMARYIDSTLCWDDLAWIKKASGGLPIVLKGIQTAADAKKAAEHGVEGILLSNHGGCSLDTTQPAMLTLLEMHKACPEVFGQVEVYVDGGFNRGTDILKAIALGATAVGIGRPWLYAINYGQEGVEHVCDILTDELVTSMKLSGITDVDEAHPGMVNTAMVEPLIRSSEAHPWIAWTPKPRL
ncbi:FMN-dependent dehydrogenase-domain-containing protein [Microdochium trichocladiopsis]|uniref:L-lactate dehydrogenase (cytochrome) n=1 Tax=Microdochium trichocladiopsis TaxID=1682393 RepID=A0A9P9BID7_9PEZI|nr:FMN-dependent dehydrogenase-domain-containing protein [Microdochium trichocladiopsis]KAH7021475.1 FMN-dependent dehydrogenase-domain-containing protein [Microdochium trichocladiopsis]